MFDVMQTWNLTIQVFRRLKWFFVGCAYAALFIAFEAKALLIIIPCFVISACAYMGDKAREHQSMDDFSGGRLFFRYGNQVDSTYIPIPIDRKWGFEETQSYAQTLRLSLAQRIAARLPESLAQVLGNVVVKDRGTGEQKEFLRVCVRSRFGSLLTHFVHYASYGQTITAHYFTYVRGIHSDLDVVKFILLSPFTLWFWGGPWLLNRYSIISHLSVYRASSFDGIDMRTMYCLTNKAVYEETEKLLTEAGLITEEIRQVIYNNIYNNNQQNISISHSSGVSLGGVRQSAQAPMPGFGHQAALGAS
jgi:hypothetical protein